MQRCLSLSPVCSGLLCLTVLAAFLCGGLAQAGPPAGTLIGTSGGRLLAIDPATGNRSVLSGSGVGSGPDFSLRPLDVVLEASGDFVVADFDARALIRVDGDTGDRTIVASETVGTGGPFRSGVVEIEPDGSFLSFDTELDALMRIDPISGNRTIIASPTVGIGPILNGVKDVLRVGPTGLGGFFFSGGDLLVVDSELDALVIVRTEDGDRKIISGAGEGVGPDFITPRGVAYIQSAEGTSTRYFVIDSGLNAVVEVDNPALSGDREIVSDASVGVGPDFVFPYSIWPSPDGALYISDITLDAVFRVDPDTGDRSIVSNASVGSGPGLGSLWNLSAVPTPGRLAFGFEAAEVGELPGFTTMAGGRVTVERAADFVGPVVAAEGAKVLYMTTGPSDRGEAGGGDGTGNGTFEFDTSYAIFGVGRGQNDPGRLRFAVDYLTAEGAQPDPTSIQRFDPFGFGNLSPIAEVSMGGPNGPSYSPLTDFTGGSITGPDGSQFVSGHSGYIVYEIEVDFPGVLLQLFVQDEGDGVFDTAMLVDDMRFVPEPESWVMLAAGGLGLAAVGRRKREGHTHR